MEHSGNYILSHDVKIILAKLDELPVHQVQVVARFIDELTQLGNENSVIMKEFSALSSESASKIWDNSYDAEYDKL